MIAVYDVSLDKNIDLGLSLCLRQNVQFCLLCYLQY